MALVSDDLALLGPEARALLDEVVALADRIAVMYRGTIVGIVPGTTSRDVLGLMMAGELPAGTELAA